MNIGIITGGETGERKVSFLSTENIQQMLEIPSEFIFDYPTQKAEILKAKNTVDIFIPLIHGRGGEDGEVQELLDKANIPYLFSQPSVHANALDKQVTKHLVQEQGILAPKDFNAADTISMPIFIKPRFGGSSLDTCLATSTTEFQNFLIDQSKKGNDVQEFLLEEALEGKEFSVGVIEVEGVAVPLPVIAIVPKLNKNFFDYESKYNSENLAEEISPAKISEALRRELQKQAVIIHKTLGCKHISRSDFIVRNDGEIYFLEINTIPGMTENSLIMKELAVSDYNFKELFIAWCNDAYSKNVSLKEDANQRLLNR